jgi:hypothetical protein
MRIKITFSLLNCCYFERLVYFRCCVYVQHRCPNSPRARMHVTLWPPSRSARPSPHQRHVTF